MTRKKFVDALLDAIGVYASLDGKINLDTTTQFVGCKVGIFFGAYDNHTKETQHYLLLEFKDGTKWRLFPERALKLAPKEEEIWEDFKKAAAADEEDDE